MNRDPLSLPLILNPLFSPPPLFFLINGVVTVADKIILLFPRDWVPRPSTRAIPSSVIQTFLLCPLFSSSLKATTLQNKLRSRRHDPQRARINKKETSGRKRELNSRRHPKLFDPTRGQYYIRSAGESQVLLQRRYI